MIRVINGAYLEAGVAAKTSTNPGVNFDPFINDDQPFTWLEMLEGI